VDVLRSFCGFAAEPRAIASLAKASRAPTSLDASRVAEAIAPVPAELAIAFGNWDLPPMGAECSGHATGVEVPTMTPKRRSPR
jgi:hypothetical protein